MMMTFASVFCERPRAESVAQAEVLIEVGVAGDRQDTACSADLPASDDHSAVVQGAILEEDRLDEAGIDGCEEALPSMLVGREV